MATDECRLMVAVFDLGERADRARAQLLDAGHEDEFVRLVSAADAGAGCAADLAAGGVAADAVAYYTAELKAGRWLVAVECRPEDVGGVLGAFGRNGGSVRVPAEVRYGRAA